MAKRKDISKLTDHLGYWLRMISNQVSHSFAQKLESSGVTVAEWVVLREMYDGESITSASHVAELTGLTRGAVSKLIARLLDKELVYRSESTEDRRYHDIELSPKAKTLVPRLADLADQNDDDFFSILSSKEQEQLTDTLKKLAKSNHIRFSPIE